MCVETHVALAIKAWQSVLDCDGPWSRTHPVLSPVEFIENLDFHFGSIAIPTTLGSPTHGDHLLLDIFEDSV